MGSIDISALAESMLAAAKAPLGNLWATAAPFAKEQFINIGQTIASIGEQVVAGQLTEAQAALELDMQKNAAETALLTVKGMSEIAAESAVNGALGAVAAAVNTALGFTLITL
jgi:hypothetical protein